MALASIPGSEDNQEEPQPDQQISKNTQINDVPESTTPWVDSVQGYKGNDTNYDVEGMPWVGNYYQMLRQADDVSDTIDALVDASYQQYTKINNYRAKLINDLAYAVTEDTKESSLEGELVIIDAIIPNRGDVWVANRGTNRVGIFVVTNVTRLSGFSNAAYSVAIKMVEESDYSSKGRLYSSLESKVVTNYYYDSKYLYLGTKPLLATEELMLRRQRKGDALRLADTYLHEFKNIAACTLTLSVDSQIIYDPYLVDFVTSVFPNDVSSLRSYSDDKLAVETFWSNLRRRNNRISALISKDMHLVRVTKNHDLQFIYGIHHTDVTYLVRPKDDPSDDKAYLGYGQYEDVPTLELRNLFSTQLPTSTGTIHPVPPIGSQSTYVVGEDWYAGSTENTIIESMMGDWLNSRPITQDKFDAVLLASKNFNDVEKFYFTPIIVFLLLNS